MRASVSNITAGYEELFSPVVSAINEGKETKLYPFEPPFESSQQGVSKTGGRDVIMLTSNNYLGLATHPEIIEAMKGALDIYGSGTCGARLHNGTTKLHVELEDRVARFMGTESSVVFSAGFLANLGALSALGDRDTVILTDQLNHMSIVEGIRLSGAEVRIFTHNNMEKLEYILQRSGRFKRKLIVVDGVYSMDGDIAPLDAITSLAKQYDAMVMVDEAHSLGFFGPTGQGVVEHFGLENEVQIRMGTFSKSLAGVGGFIAGERTLCDYLKHQATAYIFNASPPPSVCAGVLRAFEIVEREKWRAEKLWANTIRFRKSLIEMGFDIMDSVSPMIPIMIGDDMVTMKLTQELLRKGVYVATALFPAVPKGKARFRVTITAALSDDDIDRALLILGSSARQMGVIA